MGHSWPDDPEHVFYVWYDALTSYMSGIGYGEGDGRRGESAVRQILARRSAHDRQRNYPLSRRLLAGVSDGRADLPLAAKQIFAHGWLLFEQEKMSKSKGNVAYPEPIVKVLRQRRAALLPAARNCLRPGRQFLPRSPDHSLQRRSREWSRQFGQPYVAMIEQLFRWRGSARRLDRAVQSQVVRVSKRPKATYLFLRLRECR